MSQIAPTSIPGEQLIKGANAAVIYTAGVDPAIPDLDVMPMSSFYTDESAAANTTSTDPTGLALKYQLVWDEIAPYLQQDRGDLAETHTRIYVQDGTWDHFGDSTSVDRKRQDRGLFTVAEQQKIIKWSMTLPDRIGNQIRLVLWNYFAVGETTTLGTAFDGQPYFSDSHPAVDDTGTAIVQSNFFTGDLLLNEANFLSSQLTMSNYFSSMGTPLTVAPGVGSQRQSSNIGVIQNPAAQWHIYCGQQNMKAAHDLFHVGGRLGSAPVTAGLATWDVVPEITRLPGTQNLTWYLRHVGMDQLLAFVQRAPRTDNAIIDPKTDKLKWWFRKSFGFTYRWWHLMSKIPHS